MFKNLKIYYFFVALPFALLLIGSAIFFDGIKYTILRNPHPQINYTIFAIILVGGVLILLNTKRLVREARTLQQFFGAVHRDADTPTLQHLANSYRGETACLLQMVAASGERSISHQEQVAIEHELTNSRSSLLRRNALPQYLTGLLVGMGLLGTFIGLLATLNDITLLISSFAELDMQNASPLLVFRTMIERMKAPMQSMGIAFSASMFGLLGSIVLGLMMVGVRRLQGDMFSTLSSEVARHIEIALSYGSRTGDAVPVAAAAVADVAGENASEIAQTLIRIEERSAETARSQQRALASLQEDLQNQRTEMHQALSAQTAANREFRDELQQLCTQLGRICQVMENGSGELSAQVSELTVQHAGTAKDTLEVLKRQVEEQRALRETLESYRFEERLAEMSRSQNRALGSLLEDVQHQRAEVVRVLAEQIEAQQHVHSQLQSLAGHLGSIGHHLGSGREEIGSQVSELTVQVVTEARESQRRLDQAKQDLNHRLSQMFDQLGEHLEKGQTTLTEQLAGLGDAQTMLVGEVRGYLEELADQVQGPVDLLAGRIDQGNTRVEEGHSRICAGLSSLGESLAAEAGASRKQFNQIGQDIKAMLQQLGGQLGDGNALVEQGNERFSAQMAVLMAQLASDAPAPGEGQQPAREQPGEYPES